MNLAYRYSNNNIYVQPMLNRAEDKANILLARADWRADGVVPIEQFDDMFPIWVDQLNETWKSAGMTEDTKAEAIRVGIPTETNSILSRSFYPNPFYLIEMIYEKSTDNFVGFTKTWCNGDIAEHIVTSFHPDQRGKGYHDDYSVLSGKAWFIYSEGDASHVVWSRRYLDDNNHLRMTVSHLVVFEDGQVRNALRFSIMIQQI